MQFVSILGALAVLAAFAANQFGWIKPSQLSYAVANFAGAGILTVVAVMDRQVGFVVMQGAWTLISLWSIVEILRGGGSLSTRGTRQED
ncbi:MAG: CBU_0592 family membrane protein [Rubrobacteraceae bacterium]